jgi:membrane protease YdiL (CAAX protease family)
MDPRVVAVGRAFALGVAALLMSAVAGDLLATAGVGTLVAGTAGVGLGTVAVAAYYLAVTGRGTAFVDAAVPDRRAVGYGAAGVVAMLALLAAFQAAAGALDIDVATHAVERAAREDPAVLLPLVPLSFVSVGLGEELLYRNVVQKSLYDPFSRRGAVVAASAVFAVVHLPAYATGASTGALALTLAVVAVLGGVLGVVYDRTRSLLVAAAVHGAFDAAQYGWLYLELTGV